MSGAVSSQQQTTAGAHQGAVSPRRESGRQRWQWATAIGCAVFVIAMVATLMPAPSAPIYQGFDAWWHAVATAPADYKLSGPVALLDAFGRPQGMVVLPVILIVLAVARRWWGMLFAFLCYLVPALVAQVVKNLVDRPRPADPLVIVDHGSFPSGHVVSTVAFIILVAALLSPKVRRYWWPVGIVFVVAMMWSRTFLGAHWLTDTFAGAAVGTGVSLLLWWLCAPLLARDSARGDRRKQKKLSSTVESATARKTTNA